MDARRPLGSAYLLESRLGRGASGEVWRGTDREGRVFAFKLLHTDLADDPRIVERFVQERGLLASIRQSGCRSTLNTTWNVSSHLAGMRFTKNP